MAIVVYFLSAVFLLAIIITFLCFCRETFFIRPKNGHIHNNWPTINSSSERIQTVSGTISIDVGHQSCNCDGIGSTIQHDDPPTYEEATKQFVSQFAIN